MLKNIIIFLLLCSSFQGFSQDVLFNVKVVNKTTGKKEPGANLKVYDGASVVLTQVVPNSGQSVLSLKPGKKYKCEVTKEGKVTRFFFIDVTNVNDELTQGDGVGGEAEVSIFDKDPKIDYSYIETNPFTVFSFDGSNPNLKYDQAMASKMAEKIEKITSEGANKQKEIDANYTKLVAEADGMYSLKKNEEALKKYEAASLLKPTEPHPIQRINEISAILKAQKEGNLANAQKDEEYNLLVKSGDALRDQKKYDEAISKYTEALSKKPEQYPKNQIEVCKTLKENLAKAEEIEKNYQAAMSTAQIFIGQKSWSAARDKYKEALKIKPADPVATQKLADVMIKLEDQKKDQDKKKIFQQLSDEGDALLAQEKYAEAKVKYTEALKIESASTYVNEKLKEVNAKLAEIEAVNAKKLQIEKLLAEANTASAAKLYPAAKTKFEEVLKLDPTNAEAKAGIELVNQKIADEKANADKIAQVKKLVIEGDVFAKTNKNTEAKAKYEEAQKLIPDPLVQAKIDAIDLKLKSDAEKLANLEKFKAVIKEGDDFLTAAKLEEAKAKYTEAQTLDPNSAIPKAKLIEVQKKIDALAAEGEKAKKYQAAFDAGNLAFTNNDLPTAKVKFIEATTLDNTKQEAKDKLAEVTKLLADGAAAEANKKKYNDAMKAGDEFVATKKYAEALAKYKEAQLADAKQSLPAQKVTEVEALIASDGKAKQISAFLVAGEAALIKKDYATAKAKFSEVLTLDNTNLTAQTRLAEITKIEGELAGVAEKKLKIDKLIQEGNTLISSNSLENAKTKFNEVVAIDASNSIAIQKIKEIDAKIALDIANSEKAVKYKAAFDAGNQAITANDFAAAKVKFTEAISIDNSKQEAKDKLTEVNKKLGDAANAEAQKLKYDAAMLSGNELLKADKLTEAKAKFLEAQKADPTQNLPGEKLKEIEDKLLANQKVKQIESLINEGNSSLSKKEYAGAKAKFQSVLTLDPSNAIAQAKLAEISEAELAGKSAQDKELKIKALILEGDAALKTADIATAKSKYGEVISIDPNNAIAKSKLDEITRLENANKSAQAKKQQIDQLISEGNKALVANDLTAAKGKFNQVLALDDINNTAKEKLTLILEMERDALNNSANDAKFNSAVANGDQLMVQQKFLEAMKAYEEALVIKNDAAVVAKRDDARANAEKMDDGARQYQKIIDAGLKAINEKDYVRAKDMFNRAIAYDKELKKNDPLPKQKLAEIEDLIKQDAREKEILAAFTKKMAEGETLAKASKYKEAIVAFEAAKVIKSNETLPDTRIAEMNEKMKAPLVDPAAEIEKKYNDLMTAGNSAASSKNYAEALSKYNSALTVKPGDVLAQEKIREINNLQKATIENEKKRAEIARLQLEADALFKLKDFSKAKPIYEKILVLESTHPHSLKRVAECDAEMKKQSSGDEAYNSLVSKADKKFDETNYSRAKEIYLKALAFRPNDDYPKRRIKEIDNLLNPPVVANTAVVPTVSKTQTPGTVTLENPGIPTTEDDAETRLQSANDKRKSRKYFRASDIEDRASKQNKKLSDEQVDNAYDADSLLYNTKVKTDEFNKESDKLRVGNDDILKKVNDTIGMSSKDLNNIESFEIKTNQEQYAILKETQDKQNNSLDIQAVDNAKLMEEKRLEKNVLENEISTNDYSINKEDDLKLTEKKIELSKVDLDNYEERKKEEDKVRFAEKAYSETDVVYQDKEKVNLENHEAEMVDMRQTIDEINRKENSNAPANKELILVKESEYTNSSTLISENRELTIDKNSATFRSTEEEQEERGKNEVAYNEANNTELVVKTEVVAQSDRESYNELYQKTFENKEKITNTEIRREKYEELPSIATKENAERVEEIKTGTGLTDQRNEVKSSNYRSENISLNDNTVKNTTKISEAQNSKAVENTSKINEKTTDFAINTERQSVSEKDKLQTNQATLDSINSVKIVNTPDAPNALGNTYPEGISEDKFDRYDAEGLLTAVVTRRIVVISGNGNEYQKIQSLNGITYQKNGSPTTEYVWQREASDPKLKKN